MRPTGSADVDPRHLAALGFLSLGREFPKSYPETVDDRIDAVSRGFLGLTVACARCHDHKYDPIPTKDYYSLYSILSNIREPEKFAAARTGRRALAETGRCMQTGCRGSRKTIRTTAFAGTPRWSAFFKTQTADYLVAARDAESLSNPEIEDLVRDRQLNQHVLEPLAKVSARVEGRRRARVPLVARRRGHSGEPSLQPDGPRARDRRRCCPARWTRNSLESASTSLRDLATSYAAVLDEARSRRAFRRARARAAPRRCSRAGSPADVPLDEFELIYTEGDSNNTRSIRVRLQLDAARRRPTMARRRAQWRLKTCRSPAPGHVFIRGNPNNPGAPDAASLSQLPRRQ